MPAVMKVGTRLAGTKRELPHLVRQAFEHLAHGLAVLAVLQKRILARQALLLELRLHGARVFPERERPQMGRQALAQHARQIRGVRLLDIGHGFESRTGQRLVGHLSHAPQRAHLLRPEKTHDRLAPFRHHEHPVRLSLFAGQFRQKLVVRHADRGGELNLLANGGADLISNRQAVAEQQPCAGHVDERLVDGDRFDQRGETPEDREHLARRLFVARHVRRHKDALRAAPVRFARRHGGVHAEHAGLVRTGGNHAALIRPRADNHRLPAPLGMVTLLDRREEGVHIDV